MNICELLENSNNNTQISQSDQQQELGLNLNLDTNNQLLAKQQHLSSHNDNSTSQQSSETRASSTNTSTSIEQSTSGLTNQPGQNLNHHGNGDEDNDDQSNKENTRNNENENVTSTAEMNSTNLTTTIYNSSSNLNEDLNDDEEENVDYNITEQSNNDFNSSTSSHDNNDQNMDLSSYQNNDHNNDQNERSNDSNNNRNNNNNLSCYGSSSLSSSTDEELVFDALGPFEKLCKLCDCPTPSNIESASKYVVPALEFCSSQEDYMRVFSYLRKYCFYSDILLRSLWLDQIQNVIQYLHQEIDNIAVEFKSDYNMSIELALLIKDLTKEQSYQVKKCATSSLIYLVERQLLDNGQIEKIVIPCLLNLINENNEDFHIDCVSLFGKLAPLIGHDLTSKYFIQPFCRLCSSPVFHTRKACASNIADLANVVSIEEVENYLLPHFCEFMKDQVWAIRKVCADSFSSFALKCTRRKRQEVLTEYFIRLLDDNSRWVKISAYKSLGSFIATFSKENETSSPESDVSLSSTSTNNDSLNSEKAENNKNTESTSETSGEQKNQNENKQQDGEYSNFMYWRNSLPNVDLKNSLSLTAQQDENKKADESTQKNSTDAQSLSILSSNPTSSSPISSVDSSNESKGSTDNYSLAAKLSLNDLVNNNQKMNQNSFYSTQNYLPVYEQLTSKSLDELSDELKQDIVPPILLSYFITMVEVNTQNSLDSEMNYNCAYNFPAIALTLGPKNWKYIKDLYKKLAEDVSWKVRQTLAYSIHQLAIILGTEYTQTDLAPIFDSFIKDVDEVRIGIVASLTKFLKVLTLEYRKSYMPKLNDFLKMDNQRNWRFRNELGLQITEFSELFPTDCLAEYVQPVAFILALDKVAEVRVTAIKAMVELLRQFELNKNEQYRRHFIDDVMRTFANSNKWSLRQLFVLLCENILIRKAYNDLDAFSKDFLSKLLSYRNEKVPNIRVLLARTITTQILTHEYFQNLNNTSNSTIANELEMTIQYLCNDTDKDVKSYFASSTEISEKHSTNNTTTSMQTNAVDKENSNAFYYYNNESVNNKMDTSPSETSVADTNLTISTNTTNEINSTTIKQNLIYGDDFHDGDEDNDDEDEEEDDDDEDEVIDKTRINQLKIVNLENDLDDEMTDVAENNLLADSNELRLAADTNNEFESNESTNTAKSLEFDNVTNKLISAATTNNETLNTNTSTPAN